jgi:hypothetical protein
VAANNNTATGQFVPVPQGTGNSEDLKIAWIAPGNTLTPEVEVLFEFSFQGASIKVPCLCGVIGHVDGKHVVISKSALQAVSCELIRQIAAVAGTLPTSGNPLDQGLKTTKVTIRPVAPGLVVQGVETNDQLTVEFKATGVCPPNCPAPKPILELHMPKDVQPSPTPGSTPPMTPTPGMSQKKPPQPEEWRSVRRP